MGIATPTFPEFARHAGESLRQSESIRAEVCQTNTNAFNRAIEAAKSGDTVQVPDGSSFHFIGGIYASNRNNLTIDVAGSMHFVHNQTVCC